MVASSQRLDVAFLVSRSTRFSERALAANKTAKRPRSYWDWQEVLELSRNGFFPVHTFHQQSDFWAARSGPNATGRRGLPNVFARHERHGKQPRRPRLGSGTCCQDPTEYPTPSQPFSLLRGTVPMHYGQLFLRSSMYVFRRGPSKLAGTKFSDRASRVFQRLDAGRNPGAGGRWVHG